MEDIERTLYARSWPTKRELGVEEVGWALRGLCLEAIPNSDHAWATTHRMHCSLRVYLGTCINYQNGC